MARIKITDLDNQNFNLTEDDLKRINGGIIAITPVLRHKWYDDVLHLSAAGRYGKVEVNW